MADRNASPAAPTQTQTESTEPRRIPTPMFNIPEPNPIRGNNILIEMNPVVARLLCDVLDDVELHEDRDRSIYALKKGIRRYYGHIQEQQKVRNGQGTTIPVRPAAPATAV